MAKPEWGRKRICYACGSVFYDMRRDPIVCPKCDAGFDPEAILKSRRSRIAVVEEIKAEAPVSDDVEAEETEADETDDKDADTDKDDADGLIEDPSELSEDEDDVAEVREHLDEEDKDDER